MSIKTIVKSTIAKVLSLVCIWKIGMKSDEARHILMSFSERPNLFRYGP